MPDDVTDIVTGKQRDFELVFAGGNRLAVAGVVLAVGNLPPDESTDPRICANPWGSKAFRELASDEPVLILGTGLTMVDLAISIRRRGFTRQDHCHVARRPAAQPPRPGNPVADAAIHRGRASFGSAHHTAHPRRNPRRPPNRASTGAA